MSHPYSQGEYSNRFLPDGLIAIVVSFVVEFSFPLYGKFVDMGVGKGVRLEDVKSRYNLRRPKKWYSKTFYSETMKLSQILSQKDARMGCLAIIEQIELKIRSRV